MEKSTFTYEDAIEWIKIWLTRYDSELEDLAKTNKKTGRYKEISLKLEHEEELFRTVGFEIPDIRKRTNVRRLREWDGKTQTIQGIELFSFKEPNYKRGQLKEKEEVGEKKEDGKMELEKEQLSKETINVDEEK